MASPTYQASSSSGYAKRPTKTVIARAHSIQSHCPPKGSPFLLYYVVNTSTPSASDHSRPAPDEIAPLVWPSREMRPNCLYSLPSDAFGCASTLTVAVQGFQSRGCKPIEHSPCAQQYFVNYDIVYSIPPLSTDTKRIVKGCSPSGEVATHTSSSLSAPSSSQLDKLPMSSASEYPLSSAALLRFSSSSTGP